MNNIFKKFNLKYNGIFSYNLLYLLIIILMLYLIKSEISKFFRHRIKVGILFTTKEGPMALNEGRLYNMVNETIQLYNNSQEKVYLETYSYNPKSNTELYVEGAKYLIDKDVALVFGCWRSADRKEILPVFEENDNLLCYSVQYEGLECSKNVLYFGACPNQQINIGIEYGIKNISKKIVLIGSDYVFPRTANEIMKSYIKNMNAQVLDEIYVDMTETNFDAIVKKIIASSNGEKILIVNTINGDSNKYFFDALYKEFKKNKDNELVILSDKYPVMSFSLTENDVQDYETEWIYGHYFIWNYSQRDISYDSFLNYNYEKNNEISNKLIKHFKSAEYIIDDPTYHAFLSVLFFTNFLNEYEGSYDSKEIRKAYLKYYNVKQLTPTGYLRIIENNHLEQPSYILKINTHKRFETIYQTPIEIKPNPWYDRFSDKNYACNNKNFMGSYYLDSYDKNSYNLSNNYKDIY
jgi:urea transport system substrate-binding protein